MRESYRRQAAARGWVVLDGERPKDVDRRRRLQRAVASRLARAVSARTSADARLPSARRAHASSVAPVVLTSSTSTTVASGERAARARDRERARARCGGAARPAGRLRSPWRATRRSAATTGSAEMPREVGGLIEAALRGAATGGAARAPTQSRAVEHVGAALAHQRRRAAARAIAARRTSARGRSRAARRRTRRRRGRDRRRRRARRQRGQRGERQADRVARSAADRRSGRRAAA